MFFEQLLLGMIGLAAGGITAGAVYAFIVAIGLVQRLAVKTGTAHRVGLYEDSIILGGTLGSILYFYPFSIPGGQVLCGILGICYGVFVGSLIMCLAETLDVFPILSRRFRLAGGLQYVIFSLALGKMLGAFFYFFLGINGS